MEVKPALLTKTEIDFLRGLANPTPNFARVMKHRIISKLKVFVNLELPLLKEAAKRWPDLLDALKPIITTGSNAITAGSNALNTEPKIVVYEVAPGGGFEPPRPLRVTDLAGLRPTRLGRFLPLFSLGDPG